MEKPTKRNARKSRETETGANDSLRAAVGMRNGVIGGVVLWTIAYLSFA